MISVSFSCHLVELQIVWRFTYVFSYSSLALQGVRILVCKAKVGGRAHKCEMISSKDLCPEITVQRPDACNQFLIYPSMWLKKEPPQKKIKKIPLI